MGVRYRHLAAATTGLTFVLILLGVYTAATGTGLSCGAQWPACDGGLFPQSLASVPEWSHRLVAMIAGFAILGTAAGAWYLDRDARTRYAATVALAFLPAQILFGAQTVFAYGPAIQVVHHATALVIFAALIAATLWAYEGPTPDRPEPTRDADPGVDSAD